MKKSVAIIGSGPSALLLAATLKEGLFDVTIYEKNFALARKFLVAGDGGFNLTHSEEPDLFVTRYSPAGFLEESIRSFTGIKLRYWLKALGIDTYVGTSKRVFPVKGIKPIDVLNTIVKELEKKNVALKTKHTWKGWNDKQALIIEHEGKDSFVKADIVVFALGGASWPKTGSDGGWLSLFKNKGINVNPFLASNCAYEVKWDTSFLKQAEGKVLKNIAISCADQEKKGELVITKFGLEGGAIYALSAQIRKQLHEEKKAIVYIDLKPDVLLKTIKSKLIAKSNKTISKALREDLNMDTVQLALVKNSLSKTGFMDVDTLVQSLKKLPIHIIGMAPIDEAISTVGGIELEEIDAYFQLKKTPNHYVIGEMLDWDAPTGGYLLQACFSMGFYLGTKLNRVALI